MRVHADERVFFLHDLIEEKLLGHKDFLRYCKESGKKFVSELNMEDFIAYRDKYFVPREKLFEAQRL